MNLAVVQLSSGLTWTKCILFCVDLLSVTVCASILRYIDKVVFGWALHVAGVQMSPGLSWTNSILYCMYLLSVNVCASIYR